MAVGTDPITCYEGEDLTIVFTVTNVPDVTGFTFQFVVKQLSTDPDPALLTGTPTITGTQQVTVTLDVDVVGGSYVYGLRRTDASNESQYAQGALSVISSVNLDH